MKLDAQLFAQRRLVALRIQPQHTSDAAVGHAQPGNRLYQCTFACAVGAEDAEDLAFLHPKRHAVDGDMLAVTFAQIGYFDDGFHGSILVEATYAVIARTPTSAPPDG